MLHQPCKEELSDWPIELLGIGTFGNNKSLKDPVNLINHQPDRLEELSPEEAGELHKELKLLLYENTPITYPPDSARGSTKDLEKFFDCLQNLKDDRTISEQISECWGNKERHLNHRRSVVCGKGQEVQLQNTNSGIIGKKSVSYLLNKAFLCRGGFTAPPPALLRDPISQSKFEKLRLDKILRAILHKKIVPQASSPRASTKKYLDKGHVLETDSEDEASETVDRNKWDNSDTEFIVLEI